MTVLHQKTVRLVNDETFMMKPDSNPVIYFTAAKVVQFRMVADNRKRTEEAKSKHQRRQSPKSFFFNKIDLKIFRNSKTP